jgi:hypothetical protein
MDQEHKREFERLEQLFGQMVEYNQNTLKAMVLENTSSNQIVMYKLDQMEINQNNIIAAVNKTNGSVAGVLREQIEINTEITLLKKQDEMNAITASNNLNGHVLNCTTGKSLGERLNVVEKNQFSEEKIRKMIIQSFATLGVIVGIIFSIYKLLGGS